MRVDPVGEGLNLYLYVQNNPLKYIDPEGLMAMNAWNGTTPRIQENPTTASNFVVNIAKGLANDAIDIANGVAKEARWGASDPLGYAKAIPGSLALK